MAAPRCAARPTDRSNNYSYSYDLYLTEVIEIV